MVRFTERRRKMAVRGKVYCKKRTVEPCSGTVAPGKLGRAEVVYGPNMDPDSSQCLRHFEFEAVLGGPYDGKSDGDNESYSRFTPHLVITMTVTNPNVDFIPGADYYIDFTRVIGPRTPQEDRIDERESGGLYSRGER
jgi:hypothetical protein